MFDWLFEGQAAVYVLLAVVAILLLGFWWQYRKRALLALAAAVGFLMLGYYLLDVLVETDREQIQRKVAEMGVGLRERKLDTVFQHISESFRYETRDKQAMRKAAEEAMNRLNVREAQLWEIQIESIDRPAKKAKVQFLGKAQTNFTSGQEYLRIVGEFTLDPDGQWRLKSFNAFNPFLNPDQPMKLPL